MAKDKAPYWELLKERDDLVTSLKQKRAAMEARLSELEAKAKEQQFEQEGEAGAELLSDALGSFIGKAYDEAESEAGAKTLFAPLQQAAGRAVSGPLRAVDELGRALSQDVGPFSAPTKAFNQLTGSDMPVATDVIPKDILAGTVPEIPLTAGADVVDESVTDPARQRVANIMDATVGDIETPLGPIRTGDVATGLVDVSADIYSVFGPANKLASAAKLAPRLGVMLAGYGIGAGQTRRFVDEAMLGASDAEKEAYIRAQGAVEGLTSAIMPGVAEGVAKKALLRLTPAQIAKNMGAGSVKELAEEAVFANSGSTFVDKLLLPENKDKTAGELYFEWAREVAEEAPTTGAIAGLSGGATPVGDIQQNRDIAQREAVQRRRQDVAFGRAEMGRVAKEAVKRKTEQDAAEALETEQAQAEQEAQEAEQAQQREDQIRQRAQEIADTRPAGDDLANWLAAERELFEESQPSQETAPVEEGMAVEETEPATVPPPIGVTAEKVQESLDDIVTKLSEEEGLGPEVTLSQVDNAVEVDFGESKTLVIPATREELAGATPDAVYDSLNVPQGGSVTINGKTYTRGGTNHAGIATALKQGALTPGGVFLSTEGGSELVGYDSIVHVLLDPAKPVSAEALREELVLHRQSIRGMNDTELGALRGYIEQSGRAQYGADVTDIRQNRKFHEDVRALYNEYASGELQSEAQVDAEIARKARGVLGKIRSFFGALAKFAGIDLQRKGETLPQGLADLLDAMSKGEFQQRPAQGFAALDTSNPLAARRTDQVKQLRDANKLKAANAAVTATAARQAAADARLEKVQAQRETTEIVEQAKREAAEARSAAQQAKAKQTRLTAETKEREKRRGIKTKTAEQQKTIERQEAGKRGMVKRKAADDAAAKRLKAEKREPQERSARVKRAFSKLRPTLETAANSKNIEATQIDRIVDIAEQLPDGGWQSDAIRNELSKRIATLARTRKPKLTAAASKALDAFLESAEYSLEQNEAAGQEGNYTITRGSAGEAVADLLQSRLNEKGKTHLLEDSEALDDAEVLLEGMTRDEAIDYLYEQTGFDPNLEGDQDLTGLTRTEHAMLELVKGRIAMDRRGDVTKGRIGAQFERLTALSAATKSSTSKTLNFFKNFEKILTPLDMLDAISNEMGMLNAVDQRKVDRAPDGEKDAVYNRLVAERMDRFYKLLEKHGVGLEQLLSPDIVADGNMQIVINQVANEAKQASTATRIAAGAASLVSPRQFIFGPLSVAGVAAVATINAAWEMAIVGNINLLAHGKVRTAAKANIAAIRGLLSIPKAIATTQWTGHNKTLSHLRNEGPQILADTGALPLSEIALPGPGKAKALGRMIMDGVFGRALGAVDQIAQAPAAGYYGVVLAERVAKKHGISEDQARRSEEYIDSMVETLKDLGASRPFTQTAVKDATGKEVSVSPLGNIFASIEKFLHSRSQVIRFIVQMWAPVFRGAVRGGEQAVRNFPAVGAAMLAYDVSKLQKLNKATSIEGKAVGVEAQRWRTGQQVVKTTLAMSIPYVLGMLMSDDDLDKMERGVVGETDFSRIPGFSAVLKTWALFAQSESYEQFDVTMNRTVDVALEEIMPLRRVGGSNYGKWDKGFVQSVVEESIWGRAYSEYAKLNKFSDEETDMKLNAFVHSIAPLRDSVLFISAATDKKGLEYYNKYLKGENRTKNKIVNGSALEQMVTTALRGKELREREVSTKYSEDKVTLNSLQRAKRDRTVKRWLKNTGVEDVQGAKAELDDYWEGKAAKSAQPRKAEWELIVRKYKAKKAYLDAAGVDTLREAADVHGPSVTRLRSAYERASKALRRLKD